MTDARFHSPVTTLGKAIDNSGVIRERDPRASRDLWLLLLLVALFVGGMVLYAWPHFELRQTGVATERLHRDKEKLVEQNRQLKLEKASLENLQRIETIARKQLGLASPSPERLYVVERPAPASSAERLASVPRASPEGLQ